MPYKDPNDKNEHDRLYNIRNRDKVNSDSLKLYYKNHEKNKERRRQYYYDNRFRLQGSHYAKKKKLMDILGQHECLKCKISDIRVLVFDHIYGGGTKDNGRGDTHRHGIRIEYYISHTLEAVATLQVLCHNCNHLKKLENEEFRGWAWGYKNKIEN